MSSPATGTERYHPAYAMPPRIPYFSPRLAALVMLLAKIQVTRTLAVSSAVDGGPCRERAQRNVRWFSARGATQKSSSPYPTRDTHWTIELKGDLSLISEVFAQNYPYARIAMKFPRATRNVAALTTIRRNSSRLLRLRLVDLNEAEYVLPDQAADRARAVLCYRDRRVGPE